MKKLIFIIAILFIIPAKQIMAQPDSILSVTTKHLNAYGKYGQCKGSTKKGKRCRNNASKNGYCGKHG